MQCMTPSFLHLFKNLRFHLFVFQQATARRVWPWVDRSRKKWLRGKWPKGNGERIGGPFLSPLLFYHLSSCFVFPPPSTREPVRRLQAVHNRNGTLSNWFLFKSFHLVTVFLSLLFHQRFRSVFENTSKSETFSRLRRQVPLASLVF